MLFNKQQTLILWCERATNIHFLNQADYTDIFALQLAPMLLAHLLAHFSELFARFRSPLSEIWATAIIIC